MGGNGETLFKKKKKKNEKKFEKKDFKEEKLTLINIQFLQLVIQIREHNLSKEFLIFRNLKQKKKTKKKQKKKQKKKKKINSKSNKN